MSHRYKSRLISPKANPSSHTAQASDRIYLYGIHPVKAALEHKNRAIFKVLVTQDNFENWKQYYSAVEVIERDRLSQLLPAGAVHQGVAALVSPLRTSHLEDVCEVLGKDAIVLVLDQVTDPHNVGAVMRSAAAFGADAVVMTSRHAPPLTGVLAKSASGALELMPLIQVPNLSAALDILKKYDFWCYGMAEEGEKTLTQVNLKGRVALVLGSEGTGMRRLTKEGCDLLLKLPTSESFSTLNISNAAAIALFETYRQQKL